MHIVMLSDQETDGGAAVAASRLAEGLAAEHRVSRCVLFPGSGSPNWQTLPLGPPGRMDKLLARIGRGLRRRFPRWLPAASRRPAERSLRAALERLRPDVINIHNVHAGALMGWSADLVDVCAEFAPVVWTLHDMWSFTGRCAYSYDCRMFETGCDDHCPTPYEYPQLEPSLIRPAWEEKRRLFRRWPGLTAVSPSRWLAQEALCGFWAGHRVEAIANGLPLNIFRPLPREQARRSLGLEAKGTVILVSAHLLTDRRKGGDWLPRIWEQVAQRPITLLSMGHGQLAVADPEVRVVSLGYLRDMERIVHAYNAADVVLHAAPVDNLPNVAVEAVACGTPVIGMPIGGVGEIVKPGVSGWLAREPSLPSLAETVNTALSALRQGEDLRRTCRAFAEEEFCAQVQAKRYTQLFAELTATSPQVRYSEPAGF